MLMMVTDTQILSPQQVCGGCLLASLEGEPRWKSGKLDCGKPLQDDKDSSTDHCLDRYECAMGFHLALIS
jgi:hypothetical protein